MPMVIPVIEELAGPFPNVSLANLLHAFCLTGFDPTFVVISEVIDPKLRLAVRRI